MVIIQHYIDGYLKMKVLGYEFNCPYWSNKIKNKNEILRGFLDGKGDSESIRLKLEKLFSVEPNKAAILSDPEKFRKFAKRHNIGIDCSGLVYRILDNFANLSEIFPGGINKTNVKKLTAEEFCRRKKSAGEAQSGDLIRFNGGRHVALIVDTSKEFITYIHSSSRLTGVQGVHLGKINILDQDKDLDSQNWSEKTRTGESFGRKFFKPDRGDGVFRLKILS